MLEEIVPWKRLWAKSALPHEFCDSFSESNSEKRKGTLWFSPAGFSLQLVVVLEFRAMLPNIGQLIGNGVIIIKNSTVDFWLCGNYAIILTAQKWSCPRFSKFHSGWRTIKMCFICQVKPGKQMSYIFIYILKLYMGKHSRGKVDRCLWSIKQMSNV